MVDYLAREGSQIIRDRVHNPMQCMCLRAIYHKSRRMVSEDPTGRMPNLVDVSSVTAIDQVWTVNIKHHPLRKTYSIWWQS